MSVAWTVFVVLFAAVLCCLFAWCVQYHWKNRRMYRLARQFDGPITLPLIGNALLFSGNTADILDSLMKLFTVHKGPFRIWLGYRLYFGISTPEHMELIMNSPNSLEKDDMYKYSKPLWGDGLVSAPVHTWKRHRKLIAPTFNQKILDNFVVVFGEQTILLAEKLKEVAGKGVVDIFGYIEDSALAIICETVMGVKANRTNNAEFGRKLSRALEIMFLRMFQVWFHFDFIFNLFAVAKEQKNILEEVHALTNQVVKDKLLSYQKELEDKIRLPEAEIDETLNIKRKNFLDHLVELSKEETKLTDTELRDEVNTFMLAGSDTTASVVSFVLIMMGLYKDVQQKVYEEAYDILGPDRIAEPDDLPKFKYLDMVIKETMRLFPVGPSLVRQITGDIQIDSRILPKGSSVVLPVFHLHRNEKYWPDPLRFDPNRFTPEEIKKRHPYSYLPFSGGPRNCIGLKYATMSMKTMLSTIIRKFTIGTDYKSIEDIAVSQNFVLKFVHGYRVSLEVRKQ